MTRLLVLGAGASCGAGYPLTRDLLPTMAREAETTRDCQYKDAWSQWCEFLDALPPKLGVLRSSSNPEIILSLADLFDAAAEYEDTTRTEQAIRRLHDTGVSGADELERYFESPERGFLSKARVGRARLLNALESYFHLKHVEDHHRDPDTRAYLAELLAPLSSGDAVLTFNWDSLVERILLDQGKWFPADGFGFSRPLVQDLQLGRRNTLPPHLYKPSDVPVLHLHGSFGWRRLRNSVFLAGPEYLAGFIFRIDDSLAFLGDSEEPECYSPTDPLIAYPSFLKQLSHPVLAQVWRTATALLTRANIVEIVGYSLPPSDSGARALFLPIALQSRSRAATVIVRDCSQRSLDTWSEFLGPSAEYRKERFGPPASA